LEKLLLTKSFIYNSCYFIRFFVTPSDSVAIIAANAVEAIPYFSAGLKGVARLKIFLCLLSMFFVYVQYLLLIVVVVYLNGCSAQHTP
jgi:hypothetical protein